MNKTTPSDKEKIEMYEKFLHYINTCVTCANNERIKDLVHNADMWSYAHRAGNGELSDEEQQNRINANFWNLLK